MRRGRKKGGNEASTGPPEPPKQPIGFNEKQRPIELKNTNWRKA